MRTDPAETRALFRYHVVADALGPRLTPAERGALVRQLARQSHVPPDGTPRVYARATLDRWIRAYREQGLDGLRPQPRADLGVVRRYPELLEEAARLRQEIPARSAAQISAILQARHGVRVAERTIRQHLQRRGLHRAALAGAARVYGRFEADRPNELWIGDVLVGPFVPHPRQTGSRRAYLFLLVDDYSRLLVHARWFPEQTARAGQEVLRAAIQRRGLPERLCVDNGAPYMNAVLSRTCAVLGIRLIHSRPYTPQGRGKQERLNRYIRERFLLEAEARGIASFQELNDRFLAWAEQVCNVREHAETGQVPLMRAVGEPHRVGLSGRPAVRGGPGPGEPPGGAALRSERPQPPGCLLGGPPVWQRGPFVIGRHVERQVPPPTPPTAAPTGVDYLGLVQAAYEEQTLGKIAFRPAWTHQRRGGGPVMIKAPWVSHFGLTHTPFSKTIPASQLCERASLQEAVARIRFTIAEALLAYSPGRWEWARPSPCGPPRPSSTPRRIMSSTCPTPHSAPAASM
jgi:putative transposase